MKDKNEFLDGTSRFVTLKDWITFDQVNALRLAEQKEDPFQMILRVGDIDQKKVAVVVTTYDNHPDYFEVHPVCQTSSAILNRVSAACENGHDMAYFLYSAIAKEIGAQKGWRAKSPSGSDWMTALETHGAL